MANKELVDYLLSIQNYSYSQESITNVLRNAGWTDHEIEAAYNVVYGIEQAPSYAWLKAGTVMMLLVIAFVFGISSQLTSGITGNVVGTSQSTITLSQTEPELSTYEITVLEEVEVPAVAQDIKPAAQKKAQTEPTIPTLYQCEQLPSGNARDDCMEHYALKTNDKELCTRIANLDKHAACIEHVAIANREMELCHTLDNAANCLTNYAIATGDSTACAGIPNNAQRDACRNA